MEPTGTDQQPELSAPPPEGSGGVARPAAAVPLDADDTRGAHLEHLLGHP